MPDIPVVLGLHPGAKGSRRLAGTAGEIALTDDEANGILTLGLASALTGASFVTIAASGSLSAERVLTGTANQIVVTDNGAGSTVVLSTPQNLHTAATPTFGALTLTAAAGLDVTGTFTNTETTRISTVSTHTYSEAGANFDTGVYVDMTLAGAANNENATQCVLGLLTNNNTATLSDLLGGDFECYNASTGTVTRMKAVAGYADNNGGGTTTDAYGVYARAQASAGTITRGYGVYALAQKTSGTMTSAYGVYAAATGTTNAYGVYIDTLGATNKWGIYQVASADKNFLAGNLGIGNNAPDHTLDVRGEISIFGASNSLARLRLRGFYAASPADPPADQTDIILVDNGVSPVLRIRYNDAGVLKVGDVALV